MSHSAVVVSKLLGSGSGMDVKQVLAVVINILVVIGRVSLSRHTFGTRVVYPSWS